jgi:hypothetical protein
VGSEMSIRASPWREHGEGSPAGAAHDRRQATVMGAGVAGI